MNVTRFIDTHYRHFNAGKLLDAARGYEDVIERGGKMFVSMAGAMSTAQIGKSLSEMIREDKVHAICCTGANLEEELFRLIGKEKYRPVKNHRNLSYEQEFAIKQAGYNRVTDVCIPESTIELACSIIQEKWEASEKSKFPHEYVLDVAADFRVKNDDCWLIAAKDAGIPIFVPGWEDSSLGNFFAAACIKGLSSFVNKTGIDYLISLTNWYKTQSDVGFFQIGGGIAGDFAICAVPMLRSEMNLPKTPHWSYFCQISDSTTSYGGYSGAIPSEKISWDKISANTPTFMIESDATIVAPLIFAYVLNW